MRSDRCTAKSCRHVACCGVTANGRRVASVVDSQRCHAAVLYGDERCAMTREDRSNYCLHHASPNHDAGIGAFYDDPKRVEKGD